MTHLDRPSVVPAGWYRDPYDAKQRRYWDGSRWTGAFDCIDAVPCPANPAPSAVVKDRGWPEALVLFAGGAALIAGSFMPWAQLAGPLVGTVSQAGTDGSSDGWLTLGLGLAILAAVAALLRRRGDPRLLAMIGGIVAACALATVVYEIAALVHRFGEIHSRLASASRSGLGFGSSLSTSVGTGLFVCGAGAVTGLVGALMEWRAFARASANVDAPLGPRPRPGHP